MESTFSPNSHNPLLGANHLKDAVREFERMYILEAIRQNQQDKRKAAQQLGISISSLYRKLSELSLETADQFGNGHNG